MNVHLYRIFNLFKLLMIWVSVLTFISSPLIGLIDTVSETTPCGQEAFLSVDDGGRIGNQMGEYASLLAHAKRLGLRPFISGSKKVKLLSVFEHIEIPTDEDVVNIPKEALHVNVGDLREMETCEDLFRGASTNHAFIQGWPIDVEYFHPYRSEIAREFTPRKDLLSAVDTFLGQAAAAKALKSSEVMFVAVHVRRTDYKGFLTMIDDDGEDGKVVSKLFYESAMDWFTAKFSDENIIFVVISDDMSWCAKMFGDRMDVILVSSAPIELRSATNSDNFDLVLLSRCHHAIIGPGSYAFWGAYLAGGDVIIADGYTSTGWYMNRYVSFTSLTTLLDWKVLWDPCYEQGKRGVLTQECKRNMVNYGIVG